MKTKSIENTKGKVIRTDLMKNTISIKENKHFKKIYSKGDSFANHLLVIYFLPNKLNKNRLGITVNKKVGKAVVRNKVRRLIKENYRLKEEYIKKGLDIVIVARVRSANSNYKEINKAMYHLFKKVHLLK